VKLELFIGTVLETSNSCSSDLGSANDSVNRFKLGLGKRNLAKKVIAGLKDLIMRRA
jgi:hypothetical protein